MHSLISLNLDRTRIWNSEI